MGDDDVASATAGTQQEVRSAPSAVPSRTPVLEIHVDSFAYPGNQPVLQRFQLKLVPGVIVGLMGPNGCGKSTVLGLVAGELDGPTVTRTVALREEQIAWVVQDYRSSLFPWKSALANLTLPLLLRGEDRPEVEARARAFAADLGLPDDLSRLPQQLSGGEQQKLCVVRALIEEPRLLLLDESFAAMDYNSRLHFLRRLRLRLRDSGTAALLVSHSAEETFLFCDRLLLMGPSGIMVDEIADCQSREHYVENLERVHAHFLA